MEPLEAQVAALDTGRAFVDLSLWRAITVRGADAPSWLNDLLTADLDGLQPGAARTSLLLSPTGRVRAEVTVGATGDGFLLLQDPLQDTPIDGALRPYVLSSHVALEDRTEDLGLLAFVGQPPPPDTAGHRLTPSALGPGADLVVPAADLPRARGSALGGGTIEASSEALEAWRIRRGRARVGVDLGEEALPHEAELGDRIAFAKGCFLGQEAVAKVRNLGHPPFVLLSVTTEGPLSAGDPVRAADADAGIVTSAEMAAGGGSAAIVRVRWSARGADLRSADGGSLAVRSRASLAT